MQGRVLHVVPSTPFGGLQRVAALLAGEQQRAGLNVHVLALYDGAEFVDLLKSYHVSHTILHGSHPDFRMVRACRMILSRDWSVVHVHSGLLWSNTVALFSKRCPIVYHAHNYPTRDRSLKNLTLKYVNRWLVEAVIAVSKDVAREWAAAGVGRVIECVYNGVELPNATKSASRFHSKESPVFGMTTRLTKDKGIFEFLDVAEVIHAHRQGARFIIAGEGPERDELESQVSRRGLHEAFIFPGYVGDLDAFWSSIDVALFTARKEPFGLRILEPMVRGVPVAAYLTGAGSDEIICCGSKAAATAPYPESEKLAQAALNVCDDPDLYAGIVETAYEHVTDRFSVAEMNNQVMRIYSRVTSL